MLSERALDALIANIESLVGAIDDCMTQGRLLPCLSLLYTGIDVVASLERQPNEGTGSAFTRWADLYMVQRRALACGDYVAPRYGASTDCRCGDSRTKQKTRGGTESPRAAA